MGQRSPVKTIYDVYDCRLRFYLRQYCLAVTNGAVIGRAWSFIR